MRRNRALVYGSLAGLLTGLGITFTGGLSTSSDRVDPVPDPPGSSEVQVPVSLRQVEAHPTSSVQPAADARAWANAREALLDGHRPLDAHLSAGDFAARFLYAYPEPTDGRVGVVAEAAPAPWDPAHHVVRIGIRGAHEADVSGMMQVYWNSRVESWRLIGAGRRDADLTVLYEVRLSDADIGTLTLDVGPQQRTVAVEMATGFGTASPDYRVSVCAGAFAEVLSANPHLRGLSVRAVSVMSRAATRGDHPEDGELHEAVAAARWLRQL